VNSYSLLQDRFHEHMQSNGYTDFERGERGSTAEHLSVLEYKTQQEAERAAALAAEVEQKQQTAAVLDKKVEKSQERLDGLTEKISVKTKAAATVAEIDAIGKPALLGGVTATADEMAKLKTLAKKGVTIEDRTKDLSRKLKAAEGERDNLRKKLDVEIKKRPSIKDHLSWFDKFMAAMKRAPQRLIAVIEDIMRQPPERKEPERATPERKRKDYER